MRNDNGVFRITGAPAGLQEDVRGRQRRYVISMMIRTLAVILTVVLWDVERPVAIATLAVGMLLPYVAVVIANAGRETARSLPSAFVHTVSRPMITAGSPAAAPAADPRADGAGSTRVGPESRPPTGNDARSEAGTGPAAGAEQHARHRGDRV
ncbi:DUF3099 domain-containing protein [Streptomyces fuscigenes]|uniref:DUF3099 domain-containing protein n=1 Tax=Streptomyces fuscigenes TaxID=1528880 RepID=UPI001F294A9C|nr:DUF3099 domain-containing protein [Streptomyces fuscigenes]MCF3963002.1 DUF3099 domain-containing protein [Streptomyces fuscigenes]